MFLADFKYVNSHIRYVLFQRDCTSFYGTQIVPLFDKCINNLYKVWRMAIRRVWCIPWETHCNMLPLWISNVGRFRTYSIMGGNIRLLIEKYDVNVKNVVKA